MNFNTIDITKMLNKIILNFEMYQYDEHIYSKNILKCYKKGMHVDWVQEAEMKYLLTIQNLDDIKLVINDINKNLKNKLIISCLINGNDLLIKIKRVHK